MAMSTKRVVQDLIIDPVGSYTVVVLSILYASIIVTWF
jgi:hypothetical protein